MPLPDHPNVLAVTTALRSGGAAGEIRVLPDAVSTAAAAATALDVEIGQIANSLVFEADGEPLLILTSGAHRVDVPAVAAALGIIALRKADPAFVKAATGQPIGGVAPIGHPTRIRTLVDRHLERYAEVWAAGGIPHAVFPTTYAELLAITDGSPIDIE